MNFPFLSVILFSPAVAALVIMALPEKRTLAIKVVATVAAFISLVCSVYVYFAYDMTTGGFQFEEYVRWIPSLGISYHLAVDGINLPMLLLTGFVIFTGCLISWAMPRTKEFFALMMLLVSGVFGVFMTMDMFLLFLFYEIAVLPMFILISVWGWAVTRKYAAMKLTLYLLAGSIIALVGALAIYFKSGLHTFDLLELAQVDFPVDFQKAFFLPIFVGFGVLAGLWPFHTWSPDGHVAAPTAASMLHAGVLMKLGAYSGLRVAVVLLPEGAKFWLPWIVILTVVNVVYGASVAMAQQDFKYVIGYSSVSHMGLVTMGWATMNVMGMNGATLQMFSHGIMTALFFAVVGCVYDRAHTRHIPDLGGFAQKMPVVAVAFIIGGLVSMGMPGLSGFVAELQIFMGVWQAYPVVAAISALGIIITAAYILRVVQHVFFGPLKPEFEEHVGDVTLLDKIALSILCALMIGVGLYPSILMNIINTGVVPIVARLGG
jgi:NADH-quinone oxidoreductase subunit M